MYHPVKVEQLSKQQVSRLLNGHPVRVKHHPSGKHTMHMSKEQVKKIAKAHAKGGAINLLLDPYQIQHHQFLREEAKGADLNLKKIGREIKKVFTSKLGKQIQGQVLDKALEFGKASGYVPPEIASHIGEAGHRAIQAEGLKEMFHGAKKHISAAVKRGAPLLSKYLKDEVQHMRKPAEQLVENALVPYLGEPASHDIAVYGSTKGSQLLENQISNVTGHGLHASRGRSRKHPASLSIKLAKSKRSNKKGGALFPPSYHHGGALYPSGYYDV